MLNLKETYGKRYKLQLDASFEAEKYLGKTDDIAWYYEILGKYGTIYNYSESHCQLWITPRLGKRLQDHLPTNWTLTQNTSEGLACIFPNSDIGIAFKWIKPRKRRHGPIDPTRIAQFKAMGAKYRFQKEAKP